MIRPVDIETALMVIDSLPGEVHAARHQRGESLRTAAENIGCSHAHLWRVETYDMEIGMDLARKLLAYIKETD